MVNNDKRWMQLALSLGARGLGRVWPNPAVGCVIVKDNRVLGRGWTQPGGRPHAETMALAQAGEAARGATAYVTLEPCAHHGKTPPCAKALVEAGIKKVFFTISDPDSRVCGKGWKILLDAGVDVKHFLLADEAFQANMGFIYSKTRNRPMLTLKLAASLDGRIATQSGESRWITGPQARAYVHHMRATHDAVLIGRGTAEADDPMLDIRGLGMANANPVRVVVDSQLSINPSSRLVESAKDIPLWVCHCNGSIEKQNSLAALGVNLIEVQAADEGLDPTDLMQKLASQGLTRVLCEGGGQLAASLIRANLVDQLEVFHAGLLLGAMGTPSVGPLADLPLADLPHFKRIQTRILGPDTLSIWQPDSKEARLKRLKPRLNPVNMAKFNIEVIK